MKTLRRLSFLGLAAAMFLAGGDAAGQEPCKNHFILSPTSQKCEPGPNPETADPPLPKTQQRNYQGLWWGGSSEAGWNLHLSHQDDVIYALWANFDEEGRATWFSMAASLSGPDTYDGTLLKSHVQPSAGPSKYDLSATPMGTATLVFDGTGNAGTFTYRLSGVEKTKRILPFYIGPKTVNCAWSPSGTTPTMKNSTDIWFDPAEPGWALGVLHIPDALIFTWFTYDAGGSPTWLFANAFDVYGDYDASPTSWTGPPYVAETYDPSLVRMAWSTPVEIEMDWDLNLTIWGDNNWRRDLKRYLFRGNGTRCAVK